MISICVAKYQFNDDTNQRYNLLIPHKGLEQLKTIWSWKATAIKVITK